MNDLPVRPHHHPFTVRRENILAGRRVIAVGTRLRDPSSIIIPNLDIGLVIKIDSLEINKNALLILRTLSPFAKPAGNIPLRPS